MTLTPLPLPLLPGRWCAVNKSVQAHLCLFIHVSRDPRKPNRCVNDPIQLPKEEDMKLKRNPGFEGIAIPIAATGPVSNDEIHLSDSDMQRFKGIYDLHKRLQAVFKDRLGAPILVGAEIRMALMHDSALGNYTADQFSAHLLLTAEQLRNNALLPAPLSHGKALKHVVIGKLLETLSYGFSKSGTSLIICSNGGDTEAPILEPTAFVQPDRADDLQMTGSFEITGVRRSWKGGSLGLYLGENVLLVELPIDDTKWGWEAVHDVLEERNYLIGTLVRDSKSSPWRPNASARINRQEVMKKFETVTAAQPDRDSENAQAQESNATRF